MPVKFIGQVIKTATEKTIKVRVEKIKMHQLVQKPVRFHKNYLVHDESNQCVVGDVVEIIDGQRFSKMKSFRLARIVTPAARYTDVNGILHTQTLGLDRQSRRDAAEVVLKKTAKLVE